MKKEIITLAAFLLLLATLSAAQQVPDHPGPEKGDHEIQLWTGGGYSVPGGTKSTGAFNLGLRYGWVLTGAHLPSILKGRFEYAVDAVPVFVVFQPSSTAYGVGLNPLGLKWNFVPRGNVAPYVELGGGTLFTTQNVPFGTSKVNFTSGVAFGMHFLQRRTWGVEVRYQHISNAGLTVPNPGINTVQVRLGIGRFAHH